MGRGVQVGLRDVHYALLNSDDPDTGVEYSSPVNIIGAITANINPNASRESLHADDGPMETATSLGEVELELNVVDLSLATQATLLGHTPPDSGEMARKAGDTPPWVALGFKSLKSNGSYRWVWLLKGKFMVPEQNHETRGDTISFQTPTITGGFVKRDFDDEYQKLADDDEGFVGGNAAWFDENKINAA